MDPDSLNILSEHANTLKKDIEKYEKLKKEVDTMKKHFPFWIGPHGVLVPNHVESVVAYDGANTWGRDGWITELGVMGPDPTEKEWKSNYAYFDDYLNVWIYKSK
jgi:hypothetical protein